MENSFRICEKWTIVSGYVRNRLLTLGNEFRILKFVNKKGELVCQAEKKRRASTHNLIWIMPT